RAAAPRREMSPPDRTGLWRYWVTRTILFRGRLEAVCLAYRASGRRALLGFIDPYQNRQQSCTVQQRVGDSIGMVIEVVPVEIPRHSVVVPSLGAEICSIHGAGGRCVTRTTGI